MKHTKTKWAAAKLAVASGIRISDFRIHHYGLLSIAMKANPAIRYQGEVVYIYAFDVAYDTARKPIRELLGQPVAQFAVDASKRSPRQLFFYKPQMVRLPPMERIGPMYPYAWSVSSNCCRSGPSASPCACHSRSIILRNSWPSTICSSATAQCTTKSAGSRRK